MFLEIVFIVLSIRKKIKVVYGDELGNLAL